MFIEALSLFDGAVCKLFKRYVKFMDACIVSLLVGFGTVVEAVLSRGGVLM